MADEKSLENKTFKKCRTVIELHDWLRAAVKAGHGSLPVKMLSDEEGNSINGILCLGIYTNGLYLTPWEGLYDE